MSSLSSKRLRLSRFIHLLFSIAVCAVSLNMQAAAPINASYATEKTLASQLSQEARRGHRRLSYAAVWKALEKIDEDPNRPDHIIAFYSQRSVAKTCRRLDASNCQFNWNREHIWPKSHGFPKPSQWAYTDLHHLRAAVSTCNQQRSNLDFGSGLILFPACSFAISPGRRKTIEVADELKGDVARMLFYMTIRYNGEDQSETRTPQLLLVDTVTKSKEPRLGKLCTLLQWHKFDPVSNEEGLRNSRIERLQGNRNPFIDRPDLPARLWASQCTFETKVMN